MDQPNPSTDPGPPRPNPRPEIVLNADALFPGGVREVWIEHASTRYRLRITRRNKLILQK
jgi:hemin uptake protein HemP